MGLPPSDNKENLPVSRRPSIAIRHCFTERTLEYSGKADEERRWSRKAAKGTPGDRPSVEKEVPSETGHPTGTLHSPFAYQNHGAFMNRPSQPKPCLLQPCHGSNELLSWQQFHVLKPLCSFRAAALRFGPCVSQHVHHVLIINLPYCLCH